MKKIIFVFLLLFVSSAAYSQLYIMGYVKDSTPTAVSTLDKLPVDLTATVTSDTTARTPVKQLAGDTLLVKGSLTSPVDSTVGLIIKQRTTDALNIRNNSSDSVNARLLRIETALASLRRDTSLSALGVRVLNSQNSTSTDTVHFMNFNRTADTSIAGAGVAITSMPSISISSDTAGASTVSIRGPVAVTNSVIPDSVKITNNLLREYLNYNLAQDSVWAYEVSTTYDISVVDSNNWQKISFNSNDSTGYSQRVLTFFSISTEDSTVGYELMYRANASTNGSANTRVFISRRLTGNAQVVMNLVNSPIIVPITTHFYIRKLVKSATLHHNYKIYATIKQRVR